MLEINFKEVNTIAVIELSGSIDLDAANFIETIGWCLQNGFRDILCDLQDVDKVDYTGLSVLAIAHRDVFNHKGRIKLVNVSVQAKKLLSLVCLDKVFEIYESTELAMHSFQEDRAIEQIQKMPLRRRFKRLPLDIEIEFKSHADKGGFYPGKVLNLSGVGLLVFAQKIYPLGERLDIRLSLLPQPGVLELAAKVVWLVEKELQPQIYPAMGLEFSGLDSLTQEKVIGFVERNLPSGCFPED